MKIRSSLSLISHFLFVATVSAQGDSNGTYPTTFREDGFNSTEHEVNLGIVPIVPIGEIQANDPWSTPLVDGCPRLCSVSGPEPGNWTQVHDQEELFTCEEPLLFTLNIANPADRFSTFSACALTAGKAEAKRNVIDSVVYKRQDDTTVQAKSSSITQRAPGNTCGAYEASAKAVLSSGPAGALKSGADAASAADFLATYLKDGAGCGTKIAFARHGGAIVGVYSGPDLPSSSGGQVLSSNKDRLGQGVETFQLCDSETWEADTLGVFAADGLDSLDKVQGALKTWSEGKCIDITDKTDETIEWTVLSAEAETSKRSVITDTQSHAPHSRVHLKKRAECRAIQAIKDDGCISLAARCGIRGNDFNKYNPKIDCNNIQVKQWVCCSAGNVPDAGPPPQSDGTCAVHIVKQNDGCTAIEQSLGMAIGSIENLNTKTWGWSGCGDLKPEQVICVSKGLTPMPAQLPDVACGPQKIGTKRPSGEYDGFDLAKLNQCPLKACCSGWGYCGTTAEFCIESESETGAPGSFKKGENGCISNCGMDIVNNDEAPAEFAQLGYFQAYNGARDCLNMDVTEMYDSEENWLFSHIHFAFLSLTPDFNVRIPDNVADQFEKFVAGRFLFKKIVSFGGWAESTEPGTFQLYKDAVKPENRNRFAANVKAFLDEHLLDGVDFDWEYPGATDIPGVPTSGDIEAQNYLRFLTVMRDLLGSQYSLSIALPASFWYLKPFPVDKMAEQLDYFVYMTYDLHGQWDYGSKHANPGCANGNCLRSHINATETYNALSMITKAGVPAKKIFVGVTSYARSFRMADPSCTGENCLFTGSFSVSDAEPGQCTGTGGYIANAELEEIYSYAEAGFGGFEAEKWWDEKTDTDYMTFGTQGNGKTDWAAYMTDTTKERRRGEYRDLNFGGTTDWAVDLARWFEGNNSKTNQTKFDATPRNLNCDSSSWPETLEDLEKNIDSVPAHCRGMALVRILVSAYDTAISDYRTVTKDYDDKFGWYADWVKDQIDARLEEYMQPISGPGNKYIDCKWETRKVSGQGPCTNARFDADLGNPGPRVVEYFLPIRDEEGFWKELYDLYGVKKEWVQFRDHGLIQPCVCPQLPCPNQPQCDQNYFMRRNMPRRIEDKGDIDVENPKEIVDEAIPNMAELVSVALATYYEMRMETMNASHADISISLSMPLFMLEDASASIKEIKEIGEEHKKDKTRELVLMILTIVFAVIPFAGAAATAMGGAKAIATTALIVGEAGNAALTIAEVVDNPESAPFAILGALLGAGGVRVKGPRQAFKDAADVRRALDAGDGLKLFSDAFKTKDRRVQNILKACVH